MGYLISVSLRWRYITKVSCLSHAHHDPLLSPVIAEMASQPSSSVSYIPVMATPVPRKASSRNALGLPQFSLLPTPRSTSQGSPIQASPSSTSSSIKPSASPSPAPGSSGIPKFRTFRNILPFGPKQTNIGNGPPPVSYLPTSTSGVRHRRSLSSMTTPSSHESPKAGFLTFGPRSSFSMNRRSPAPPSPNRSRSEDHSQSPVISIQAPIATSSSTTQTTPESVQSVTLSTPQDSLQLSGAHNPIGGKSYGILQYLTLKILGFRCRLTEARAGY